MGVLHTLNRPLNIFLVKDIFQQLHHLGNIQLLDLRCDAFQSSCNGTKSVSAAFTFAVLVILDAVFQTLDFVVKPIKEQTIVALLDEVLKKNELDEDCFTYKIGALEYHRPYRDILYVASQRRKNCVVTQQGTDCYYGTLSKVEDELAAHGFIRVHQSFLVNLRHIVATSPTKVVMSNNEELPVGDVYQQNLAQALLRKKRKG